MTTDADIDAGLTGILAELAEAADDAAALKFARAFGGLEDFYVPQRLRPGHVLTVELGRDAAQAVVTLWGGSHIEVPMGPEADAGRKRRQIAAMIAAGKSNPQIARAVGCHMRTVRRVRARARGDAGQADLFARLTASR